MIAIKNLVNLYMVLFILDGIVSLADVLASRFLGIHILHGVRGLASVFPFVMALPLYCIMGCMRGFPKRVLLPLIVFIAWSSLLIAMPLPFFVGVNTTDLLLSAGQPVLGLLALLEVRRSGQSGGWLYGAAVFEQARFSGKRLCGFVAANALVVIPLTGLYLGVSASIGIAHLSNGFIHLGARGVSVEARTYRYNDKSILLLPTVHIADRSFYSDLLTGLPSGQTVIIPEGVTDEQKLLAGGLGYEKLAPALGLEAQNGQTFTSNEVIPTNPCDIDVSTLSPEIVAYLNAVGNLFRNLSTEHRTTALLQYLSTPVPDGNLLWKEIVEDRNQRVETCILDSLENYDFVAVPWGAGHMPGIEKSLLDAGAVMVDSRRVWVVQWSPADDAPRTNNED